MSAARAPARRRIPAETLAGLGPLWQGDAFATSAQPGLPSGFAVLDAELPGGGWPASGFTELLLAEPGCGEVRLLAPALAQRGETLWIAPPHPPYAPALHALGLALDRLVWIDPASEADAAWAAEQALRSGSVGAVLWWSRQAVPATLRRLHLAALDGGTPLFGLRALAARGQSSPAPLRLALAAAPGGVEVDIFKRRGPALAQPVAVALPSPRSSPRGRRRKAATDVVAGPAPAVAAA
jgi:protein ImuA